MRAAYPRLARLRSTRGPPREEIAARPDRVAPGPASRDQYPQRIRSGPFGWMAMQMRVQLFESRLVRIGHAFPTRVRVVLVLGIDRQRDRVIDGCHGRMPGSQGRFAYAILDLLFHQLGEPRTPGAPPQRLDVAQPRQRDVHREHRDVLRRVLERGFHAGAQRLDGRVFVVRGEEGVVRQEAITCERAHELEGNGGLVERAVGRVDAPKHRTAKAGQRQFERTDRP